jgi:FAD/FMN-containing dehydrogenase
VITVQVLAANGVEYLHQSSQEFDYAVALINFSETAAKELFNARTLLERCFMTEVQDLLFKNLGRERYTDDPGILESYSRDESFALPLKPWGLVKPQDVNEVQHIVKWANQTQTPLVPVSSGPPHFHGDTVPSSTGAVMVDLTGMNRTIKLDRRNKVVYIEAGVTYSQLQPQLAKEGLSLSMPLIPRANKSVVASLLEREPRLIPRLQWAALEPLRCIEVVWGDGQIFRTGEAGFWPSLEAGWDKKQAAVSSSGPGQTDFYRFVSAAQGSMGIVTWASVKCDLRPEFHKLFFIPASELADLIDFVYQILRIRFGDELMIMNNSNLAYILGDGLDGARALKEELPPWVVLLGIAGRSIMARERVEYQEQDIGEIAQKFGLQLLPVIPGAKDTDVLQALLNPSREPHWKIRYKGNGRDIFFLTTLDKSPHFVRTMNSTAEARGYSVPDIGVYIQPMHQGVNCHCEFNLPFERNNLKEVTAMRDLYTAASEDLLKQGAFFSRPYGIWADMAYNRDAQTKTLLRKVKKIFDPNNIMNPGKLCF